MTNNNQEIQDRVNEANSMMTENTHEHLLTCLVMDLNTALKQEQSKSDKYEQALKTISQWQDTSDSQDAIHAANTAIEALGEDYE